MPSLRELFNIISYFDMTPAEFFAPLDDANTPYRELCEKLRTMNEEDLEKVSIFIGWIEKKEEPTESTILTWMPNGSPVFSSSGKRSV